MSNPERWYKFNPLPSNIKQAVSQLHTLFQNNHVQLAYLFGSLSKADKGQDVDLALLTANTHAYRLRSEIINYLGTERLDLVDLKRASPVLRFEIIRSGYLIYAISDTVENNFELATLHLYRDTSYMRSRQKEYLKERMKTWSLKLKPSPNV